MKILGHHPLSIEKPAVQRNRMPHDLNEAFTILVEAGQDLSFQLVIQRRGMAGIHVSAWL
jgi:hypothetical protein